MIFIMAWRNVWRNKGRSIIIMLSIALGVIAGIAVQSLYKGMIRSRVRTVIDTEIGHIQLHDPRFKNDFDPQFILKNSANLLEKIQKAPLVKMAAPRSITYGMLATATGSASVKINGVLPAAECEISQLREKIIEGRLFDSSMKQEVMIGKKLAGKMKLRLGSKLVLTFTDSSGTIVSGSFRVNAIYQSNNGPLDERNVYVTASSLNELLTVNDNFHEIVVLLKRDEDVQVFQQQLLQQFPGYGIESWKEISPETELMVNTTDKLSYILMIIIMFALSFGIVNTMLMSILERTREIGMMVALGTRKMKIFVLVLLETIFLTVAGTPVGIGIGWLITSYFHRNGLDLSGMGKEMMASFGYSPIIYPEFPSEKIAGVILIVVCTAFLACIFPALKALKLQPVEALRR